MDVVLIAGLWLDGSAWDEVVPELDRLGHRGLPLTLPGQGDGARAATLEDQVAHVVAALDAAPGRPVVVGHSAAATLAWQAADARPDGVAAVVLVGGFPACDGDLYAGSFAEVDGVVPFPGWEPFEGPDAADLDEVARERFAAATVPVPAGVARGVVRLRDERRFEVPVTVVCPEFSPDQARAWIEDGAAGSELARTRSVDLVDIDSGHWPMVTRPRELAALLAHVGDLAAARRAPDDE